MDEYEALEKAKLQTRLFRRRYLMLLEWKRKARKLAQDVRDAREGTDWEKTTVQELLMHVIDNEEE